MTEFELFYLDGPLSSEVELRNAMPGDGEAVFRLVDGQYVEYRWSRARIGFIYRDPRPMQVYEVTETDWVMAHSAEEARHVMLEMIDEDEGLYSLPEIKPLTDAQMKSMKILDEDEPSPRTFAEELQLLIASGITKAQHFASTEY